MVVSGTMVFSSAAVFTTPDSEVPAIPFQYAAGAVAVYPVRLQEATFDVRVPLSASDRQPLHPRYQTRYVPFSGTAAVLEATLRFGCLQVRVRVLPSPQAGMQLPAAM